MHFFPLLAGLALATATYVPGKSFDRFVTIWLENQDFTKVDGNPIITSLAKQGIRLTNYYGLTHPSQPNYIAAVGGDYFGLNHDGLIDIPRNVSTVVDLFDTKAIEWKGYFEGMPGPGYMGPGSTATDGSGWDYVRKHNPFVSYGSVSENGTRLANLQSFTDFQNDVKRNTLPQYAHLSPDMRNDGHDTSLEYAANWTQSFLSPLLNSKQFMERTLVLLTYDESETYSIPNRIVSLLLGGTVPENLRGTNDDTFYTHYSILSTLENNWGLPNLGRYDVGANVFDLVAGKTGYKNQPLTSPNGVVDNSVSYGGFFNDDPKAYLPIPPPNLQLTGAGHQGVVDVVHQNWRTVAGEPTPYDGSGKVFDGSEGQIGKNTPVYKPQSPNIIMTEPRAPTTASGVARIHAQWVGVVLAICVWAFII